MDGKPDGRGQLGAFLVNIEGRSADARSPPRQAQDHVAVALAPCPPNEPRARPRRAHAWNTDAAPGVIPACMSDLGLPGGIGLSVPCTAFGVVSLADELRVDGATSETRARSICAHAAARAPSGSSTRL